MTRRKTVHASERRPTADELRDMAQDPVDPSKEPVFDGDDDTPDLIASGAIVVRNSLLQNAPPAEQDDGLEPMQRLRLKSPRRARFAEEYAKDLAGKAAALRAGCPEPAAAQQAYELLDDPMVQAAVRQLIDERSARTKIDADYVLTNAAEVIERCMQRAPVMQRRGKEWVQKVDEEGRHVWKFDALGALTGLRLVGELVGAIGGKKDLPLGNGVLVRVVREDVTIAAAVPV